MFSWKLKFWHQWWKTWKNDQIYRTRVVPSMMCLQFHSHKKLGSKNTLKGKGLTRAYNLQYIRKFQAMSSWQVTFIKVKIHVIFVLLWPFLRLLHLLCCFFLKLSTLSFLFSPLGSIISEAFVISSTTAKAVVTGTILPFTSWVQWSHNLQTRYQEKTSLPITYIFLKTFSTDSFFSFSYLANVYILHSFGR